MAVSRSGKDKILRWTRLYLGGYDLSGDSRSFGSATNNLASADITGWSEAVRNYLSERREVGFTGYQVLMNDTATTGAFSILKTPDVSSQLSLCFGGGGEPATGDPAFLMPSVHMSAPMGLDGNVPVLTADFLPDADQYDANTNNPLGYVLRGATEITATVTAASANTVDYGGQTTNGWIACLHVLATSSGDYAFTLRDSTDDSAFADLGTFTLDGSTVGSEYLTGSGTIDQYVGLTATKTAGSCTVVVTLARNI